ncbi:MAG TPA: hypothetical protein VJB15_10635 [Rhodothermia bacterium]|nr:hypothetical protein [Rhodothermia bacterium]
MTASLRAFLDGLIDYAGLFPPANLGMPEAVKTYARHLASDHAWMVGRFVCPVGRLDAFESKGGKALRKLAPVKLAGLASPMNHAGTMMGVAAIDAVAVRKFEQEGWGVVDVLEVRLPDDLVGGDPSEIPLALDRYESELRVGGMHLKRVFYEVGRTPTWNDRVERVAAACSREKHRGIKIRCGGATADAYPSVDEVARAVAICARLRVPYKATAGLHHPVRHEVRGSRITQHGFVNVFAAGLLASKLDADSLRSLVDDRDLAHFDFADEHLAWDGHKVPLDAVKKARRSFAISYGSCDIDEPVEDLGNAGLL